MISTSRHLPNLSKKYLGAAISLSVFALTACTAEAENPQTNAANITVESKGILETSTGSYVFTPSTCVIYNDDGVDDIEIQGPGTAPDGEKFFFEFTSTGNAVTINLGVDSRFTSSERKFQAGQHVSKKFTFDVSGSIISVSGLTLVDNQGQAVDAEASLRIDCGT